MGRVHSRRFSASASVVIGIVLQASVARAGIIETFTNDAPFSSMSVNTFDGMANGNIETLSDVSVGDATLLSIPNIFAVDGGYNDGVAGPLGAGSVPLISANGSDFLSSEAVSFAEATIEIEFDSPMTAVGLNLGGLLHVGMGAEIGIEFEDINGGFSAATIEFAELNTFSNLDTFAFRGFTFDGPGITLMSISLSHGVEGINALGVDNLFFGSASDLVTVPVPGAAVLAIVGFGAVGCVRRRFA